MHEYVPGELSSTSAGGGIDAFGFNSGTNNLGPSIGSVTLPIPSGISDQNKADWGSNSMTALDLAKADIAKTAIFDGLQDGAEKFTKYVDAVRKMLVLQQVLWEMHSPQLLQVWRLKHCCQEQQEW